MTYVGTYIGNKKTEIIFIFLDWHLRMLSGSVQTKKCQFYNLIWAILSNMTGGSIYEVLS